MKLLVTAFDAFGGDTLNISQELLSALPDRLDGAELLRLVVPTVFGTAAERTLEAAERFQPDVLVCLGQAAGRRAITPERVAVNLMDASLPDNAGFQPVDEPIVPGGPAAYFSTLPVKAMAAAVREQGIPAEISNTAGTFVCNSLMYAVLHRYRGPEPAVRCGFMHLPCPSPELGRDALVRGVTAALRVLIQSA